ncbi:MAG: hypothetical protein HY585_00085, partial [Candidatus Omnitrophica bacterium]|nr:hypothetical protein [Candidatus Omnitrophota bacterium]
SIGSGTRRIEAITGLNAVCYFREISRTLSQLASVLKVNPDQVAQRVEKIQEKLKSLERSGGSQNENEINVEDLIASAQSVGKVKMISKHIPDKDIGVLRNLADQIRSKAKDSVLVLFSTKDSKVNLLIALTKDLTSSKLDAKEMAQKAAYFIDGSAGGRKDMAQGGGRNLQGIDRAIQEIANLIRQTIGR